MRFEPTPGQRPGLALRFAGRATGAIHQLIAINPRRWQRSRRQRRLEGG
jgi:hypothetical protein